uniref:VapB-type antitoxin n=1 Tax=Metallosphaera hakonensis JCM 8857 = DSM 7519 TaxID=1293036 RepID=A0A2U9IR18_9CREN
MNIVKLKTRVNNENNNISKEMVKMTLTKSNDQAFNTIPSYGIRELLSQIEEKRRASNITEKRVYSILLFELST